MKMKSIILCGIALALAGCTHSVQTTSGADYLAGYSDSTAYGALDKTNTQIYDIANIEPDLRFPARIGIARISNKDDYGFSKGLTAIPADESEIWTGLVEREGHRYGEFVPVSPFITAMVAGSKINKGKNRNEISSIVEDIRKGAARQHLDYVLVYEVTSKDKRTKNGLGFTDATVLGLFLIPSRKVKVDTIASAVLLDVRNGYPYMTASSFSEHKSNASLTGSKSKRLKLEDRGRVEAVEALSVDIENALQELKDAAYEKLVAEGY